MSSFCNAVASGHLGHDAHLKEVNGQSVLEFSIAYNARKDDPPTWFRCAMWGSRGEKLKPHLTKGTAVIVSGSLNPRHYEGKDGTPKMSLDIRVDQFSFAGGGGEQIPAPASEKPSKSKAAPVEDDDQMIPF